MLEPEYRVGFKILRKQIGFLSAISVGISAIRKSKKVKFMIDEGMDEAEQKKVELKNHFILLANMYNIIVERYGFERAQEIMKKVLMGGGQVFMRHFTKIGVDDKLSDFIPIYKAFESQNLMFEVLEESEERFEVEVHRCLIYESFKELGIETLTKWMCDIAFEYFNSYHPNIKYEKDRMIARGDKTCHEVFFWILKSNNTKK